LTLEEAAQLLWAAQGRNNPEGRRTAPSAGALYPLEIYLLAGQVAGLPAGVYRYQPSAHALATARAGDQRTSMAMAALEQMWMRHAPAVLLIAAVPERTRRKYGERSGRYVAMEVGHAAQSVYLQAGALGLGTVAVGAFEDDQVAQIAGFRAGEEPQLLLPVGRKKE
jgi:SagB-type dehydrogenase family enzyme